MGWPRGGPVTEAGGGGGGQHGLAGPAMTAGPGINGFVTILSREDHQVSPGCCRGPRSSTTCWCTSPSRLGKRVLLHVSVP